jgi:hypothetical protein
MEMDEATERKIRDLKLKILKVEKELAATQHSANLGSWLHAGHAGQIQKTAERDRKRLEAKLEELRAQLEQAAPGSIATTRAAEKSAKVEPAPAEKKKAAVKKPAAKGAKRK